MDAKTQIEHQFSGFLKTPNLWLNTAPIGVQPFIIEDSNLNFEEDLKPLNQRLGKRIEEFVEFCLNGSDVISHLKKSLQIKSGKQTIGELDFLFIENNNPIHLEVAYKFYLHDPNLGDLKTIESWVGPNKKDNLYLKSEKLRLKQLPLLYHKESARILETFQMNPSNITQRLSFKAQLYVPYNSEVNDFGVLNPDCVAGYYLHQHQLSVLQDSNIYIPKKLNWGSEPQATADYRSFQIVIEELLVMLQSQRSPLLWLKSSNGDYSRCFVVWW
ncbi:DUF1853 family protein [Winogradskyella maritima]|uniref:DUF1853 family protein n=1 Tax=Winogradskyella maritima TaxID=1517766 RepID=A0ABV8AMS1_9FLAO|nr:DUF1853 family protein [Winogradskyella maritima]